MSIPAGRNVVRAARPIVSSARRRRIELHAPWASPRARRRSEWPGSGVWPRLAASREAKERMSGLRVVAVLVGLAEGLLGLGEVAEAEPRLPELVEGRARDPRAPGPQFFPGLAGQFLGLVEAAPEAHDLRVVHAAHPGEGRHG